MMIKENPALAGNGAQQITHANYITAPVDQLLPRLEKVKQTGSGRWVACCPAHDDRTPSLSIRQADDGKLLLCCFAGCEASDIAEAVGLSLSDLFASSPMPAPKAEPIRDSGKRDYARRIWARVTDNDRLDNWVSSHLYCQRKGIGHAYAAARIEVSSKDSIVIPIRQDGTDELLSVQIIGPDGGKRTYGAMDDGYLLTGNPAEREFTWIVVEGWATGWAVSASLHRLGRPAPVLIAFGGSRLERVREAAERRYGTDIRILRDGEVWS